MKQTTIIRIISRRVLSLVPFFVFRTLRRCLGYVNIFVFCLVIDISPCCAQGYFSTMFLNCENAFDIQHDDGKNDYSFLPDGEHHWTRYRFFSKLKGIAKTIAAVDEHQPVSLVGLCEVENDTVLTYLTENTMLHRMGYKYVITHSDDPRGMNVALLYQPYLFTIIDAPKSIRPQSLTKPTRDILRVCGRLMTGDTLYVYVCHLPSKLGGREAEENRNRIAAAVCDDVDSILHLSPEAYIIVIGDFNSDGTSSLVRQLKSLSFVDLTDGHEYGSYKYHGEWSFLDHILVSSTFLHDGSTLRASHDDFGVLFSSFFLEIDKKYGGKKPRRTYRWTTYNGGVSDHLPIWMKIRISPITTSK